MASNTAKPVALAAVALVLWFGAYWYWEPSNKATRITYGLPPAPAAAASEVSTQEDRGMFGSPIAAAAVDVQVPAGTGLVGMPAAQRRGGEVLAPKPRVVPPEFTMYTVQRGDVSFETIARRLGGGAKLAEAIRRANPFVPPSKLLAGKTQLRVPSDPENVDGKLVTDAPRVAATAGDDAAAVQAPPPGSKWPMNEQSHTVAAGETLSGIAAKYYSGPMAWKRVFEANRDVMAAPEKLKVGTTLRIPPGP